ncbi:kinase-like domain-containing protein [Usnea florida]
MQTTPPSIQSPTQVFRLKLFAVYICEWMMSSQSNGENDSRDSVMREFLQDEDENEFEWPSGLGEISGSHCNLESSQPIPFTWKRRVSDRKASIDEYEAPPLFTFKKRFVVKTIRERDSQKAQKMTAKEVHNMKGLRHPHIAALLGTFTHQARVNILIFPAARCDLQYFMNRMSNDSSDPNSTETSQKVHSLDATSKRSSSHGGGHRSSWPVILPAETTSEILRGYFVCLSQALSYLHEQDVRHKDIKPANILIDYSNSVILTDFGISRRFPKNTSHFTDDEVNFTRKYASPEMAEDRRMGRDDASDVFSMGCVFLEMATFLLEGTLKGLSDRCSTIVNESAKDEDYHRNLQKVDEWIKYLRGSRGFTPVLERRVSENSLDNQEFPPSSDNHLIEALADIREMLDEVPQNRPVSTDLWHKFKNISSKLCRDCDPRSDKMWKPSERQKKGEEEGLFNRRSLQTHEIELKNRERDPFRETETATLSASDVPRYPSSSIQDLQRAVVEGRDTAGSNAGTGLVVEAIPRDIGVSASTPSTASMLDAFPQAPSGDTSTTKPIPLDQAPTQHTAAKSITWLTRLRWREAQRGATNKIILAHCETPVRISEMDMPESQATPVIVYDGSQDIVFQTHCGWLMDSSRTQDILCCPLPRLRQKLKIARDSESVTKVNLKSLGWTTVMHRLRGKFPKLYVVNFSSHGDLHST